MLVLSRKLYESIVIDPRTCPTNELGLITITVVEISAHKVKLGTEAPKAVRVDRAEVYAQRTAPHDQVALDRWADNGGPTHSE